LFAQHTNHQQSKQYVELEAQVAFAIPRDSEQPANPKAKDEHEQAYHVGWLRNNL